MVEVSFFSREPDEDRPRRLAAARGRAGGLDRDDHLAARPRIVTANRAAEEGSLHDFLDELAASKQPIRRVPGTAVFLNPGDETTPLALRAEVEHNHVLHEKVLIVSVDTVACRTSRWPTGSRSSGWAAACSRSCT